MSKDRHGPGEHPFRVGAATPEATSRLENSAQHAHPGVASPDTAGLSHS